MIHVNNLHKEYKVIKKEKGLSGAVKGLFTKSYETIEAVSNLNFHINPGEIVGFIGPNGAGKSTTIKMMTGILTPTSGEVLIGGTDITKNRKEVTRDIGVVFGQRTQLNWDLRLEESFELLRHIYRIDKVKYQETLEIMDEILGIKELLDKPVRQMSLGQRVKGDLVASMIHDPKVLFLDEPTIGLDATAKYSLRKFIKEINQKKGTTIVLTTHDLGDIEELCKRIMIINSGKLIEDGDLKAVCERIAPYRTLCVQYYDDRAVENEHAQMTFHEGNMAKYRFMKSEITAAKLISELSDIKPIQDISIEEAGIDDIIRIAYSEHI